MDNVLLPVAQSFVASVTLQQLSWSKFWNITFADILSPRFFQQFLRQIALTQHERCLGGSRLQGVLVRQSHVGIGRFKHISTAGNFLLFGEVVVIQAQHVILKRGAEGFQEGVDLSLDHLSLPRVAGSMLY